MFIYLVCCVILFFIARWVVKEKVRDDSEPVDLADFILCCTFALTSYYGLMFIGLAALLLRITEADGKRPPKWF